MTGNLKDDLATLFTGPNSEGIFIIGAVVGLLIVYRILFGSNGRDGGGGGCGGSSCGGGCCGGE